MRLNCPGTQLGLLCLQLVDRPLYSLLLLLSILLQLLPRDAALLEQQRPQGWPDQSWLLGLQQQLCPQVAMCWLCGLQDALVAVGSMAFTAAAAAGGAPGQAALWALLCLLMSFSMMAQGGSCPSRPGAPLFKGLAASSAS
jgi:hypothetical protein